MSVTKRKRETAQERDERIVAEAGPWRKCWAWVEPTGVSRDEEYDQVIPAAARILNRIAKKRGEK